MGPTPSSFHIRLYILLTSPSFSSSMKELSKATTELLAGGSISARYLEIFIFGEVEGDGCLIEVTHMRWTPLILLRAALTPVLGRHGICNSELCKTMDLV